MRELIRLVQSLPDIEIAETPEDFTVFAERSLQSREKVIYYAGSIDLLLEAYAQAYEDNYYIPTRMKARILVKMLAPDSEAMRTYRASDTKQLRLTRCLPADVQMDYSVMIHDDTVVFFAKDETLYGLSVVSPAIAQTMKVLFDALWRSAE